MGVNFPEKNVTLENMATGIGLRVHVSVSGCMYGFEGAIYCVCVRMHVWV